MAVSLACLVLLTYTSFAWSQTLLVRWNNTLLIGSRDSRRLIYHNEIIMENSASSDGNGVLICRFSGNNPSTGWRRPDGSPITSSNISDFREFRRSGSIVTRVQLARARDPLQDGTRNDGLWTCNANGHQPLHVPLYTPGRGVIVIDNLTLEDSPSFSGHSPRVVLIAHTRGGPPTNFMWRRNGRMIRNDSTVDVNPNGDATGRMSSIYRGFLVITDVGPGVYTYETYNRATSPSVSRNITVEGGSITNLQVTQTGMNMVRLSWNPPPGPPINKMYNIAIAGMRNLSATVTTTTYTIELGVGSYDFKVMFMSQHFPAIPATHQNFIVRGAFAPAISLSPPTTTSVTVSWSQPRFSFTVQYYEVSVARLTLCSEVVGIRGPRHQNSTERQELFEDLDEFIHYKANITALFQSTPDVPSVTTAINFTTQPTVPSRLPRNVILITSSRTISVSWDAIGCSHQNGPNFRYDVEFLRMDGGSVPVGTVNNVMFTVMGLQPFSNYTFRVRGVNDFGSGNYTSLMVIQTNGEAPSDVPGSVMVLTLTSEMIGVSWDAIDTRNQNGPNFYYDVEFLRMDGGPVPVGTVNNVMFTVMGLQPFTNYTFRVRGVNNVGNGNYTRIIMIQTFKDVLSEAPSEVPSNLIFNVTSRSVSVSWDPVNSSNENSPNFHYQLEFMQIGVERLIVITTVDDSQLINGLQPFTNYTFRVRGVNDYGNGNYTSLTFIQTSEDVPGSVLSLDYQYFNSNLVLVTWNPPLVPNGIIIMYELIYHLNQHAVSKNISSYLFVIVASEANSRISGIRVRAYTSIGPGPFAEAILMSAHSSASTSPVAVIAGVVVTFPLGVVCGAVGAVLVVYCALKWRGGRGKLDLNPAGGVYEDVKTGPLYEDVTSATAAAPHVTPGPQLELRENVAYGHVGTK